MLTAAQNSFIARASASTQPHPRANYSSAYVRGSVMPQGAVSSRGLRTLRTSRGECVMSQPERTGSTGRMRKVS